LVIFGNLVNEELVNGDLTGFPWVWPWSSARAHTLDTAPDVVLDCGWEDCLGHWDFGEWKDILSASMDEIALERVRRATLTREPLGSREFLANLERRTGKHLRMADRGRHRKKPLSPEEATAQGCLFSASHK
jgi:hypothetical protein